jgi:hypothetical protein
MGFFEGLQIDVLDEGFTTDFVIIGGNYVYSVLHENNTTSQIPPLPEEWHRKKFIFDVPILEFFRFRHSPEGNASIRICHNLGNPTTYPDHVTTVGKHPLRRW